MTLSFFQGAIFIRPGTCNCRSMSHRQDDFGPCDQQDSSQKPMQRLGAEPSRSVFGPHPSSQRHSHHPNRKERRNRPDMKHYAREGCQGVHQDERRRKAGRAVHEHGDIGGRVSAHLEERFEGAVANWIIGTAGDQNPIISNEYFTPNPETGAQEIQLMGRAAVEILEFYGKVQFADALQALKGIETESGDALVRYATGDASLPAYTAGEDDALIQLRLLRIGDIALVGTSGELFNSIGMYMRSHSLLEHTLVSNQVRTYVPGDRQPISGYQPDDYALVHDGWHTNNRRYAIGTIDGGYTRLMNQLIESTGQ